MKSRILSLAAFASSIVLQGCDSSGFGCSHIFSFIPTTMTKVQPLSLRRATINSEHPLVVDIRSYISNGEIFTFSLVIKNTSHEVQQVLELVTTTEDGLVVPSPALARRANECKPPACNDRAFTTDAKEVALRPREDRLIKVEINLKDVKGFNELTHKLNLQSITEQEPYTITWSMTRIERRINCITGSGHDYRLVEND